MKSSYTRLAPSSSEVDAASRVVRYVFSDESVGRDGHIVKADAWQTENFESNPVFLWAHLDTEPPIGRVIELNTVQRKLVGAVKYAETEFADSIFQLVRGKFLNAVSTSWMPIEWQPRDRTTSGLIFTEVDLLEISQVPVGALPTALAEARSRGINTRPIASWAERALDTQMHRGLDRSQVEAIARAGRMFSTRSERSRRVRERVREIQERETRRVKAREHARRYGLALDQYDDIDLPIPWPRRRS